MFRVFSKGRGGPQGSELPVADIVQAAAGFFHGRQKDVD